MNRRNKRWYVDREGLVSNAGELIEWGQIYVRYHSEMDALKYGLHRAATIRHDLEKNFPPRLTQRDFCEGWDQ